MLAVSISILWHARTDLHNDSTEARITKAATTKLSRVWPVLTAECPSVYWPPTSARSDTNFGSTRPFFNTRPTPHPLKKTHARVGVSAPLRDS
ncbi:Uncharacterized protein DAT39_006969 [Clarias magur]|uniref:Uncharacterized protein n=1 Tax=Clarias magur TaxID=1594786 RepID=A0A8J4X6B8_CLAMG|nr:Uncharacterized protein DAT39_006969 [Clarias magur]